MLPFLIASCAVCVGLYLYTETKNRNVAALLFKMLSSLCFVLIGLLNRNDLYVSKFIILGLIFGFIADILVNLRYIFRNHKQLIHLTGVFFFLLGHIVYLIAASKMSEALPVLLIIGIIISIFIIRIIYKNTYVDKAIRIAGIIYIEVLTLLNAVAIGNFILSPTSFEGVFALGTFLFLISDILLMLNTFGSKKKRSVRVIHISIYYLGQMLIALSLGLLK